MKDDSKQTNSEKTQFITKHLITNKFFWGFILYFSFGDSFFKVIFIEGFSTPILATKIFAIIFLLLTSYPLFIRHIEIYRKQNKFQMRFPLWVLISALLVSLEVTLLYFEPVKRIISIFN